MGLEEKGATYVVIVGLNDDICRAIPGFFSFFSVVS